MRFLQLIVLCFICFTKVHSQPRTRIYTSVIVEITKEKKPKKIYTKVAITSVFPEGDSIWVHSLEDSLNKSFSVKNRMKAGKYFASVRFLVEKDGSFTDFACLKDPGFEICEKIVFAIRRKSHWGPASNP